MAKPVALNTVLKTDSPAEAERRDVSSTRARLGYAAVLATLFCLLTWPVIFSGSTRHDKSGAAGDQDNYHWPTILKMEKAWPHPDLNDLSGAQMTPTFHVIMAAILHYGKTNLTGLRFVNSFTGLFLIVAVYWYTSRWTRAGPAFVLCLPYLFSPFMLSCAMWLMTSDFALLFAAIALAGAAMYPPTGRRVFDNGLAAMAATAIRQIHVWLIAPMLASIAYDFCAGWLPLPNPANPPAKPQLLPMLLKCAVATLLPVAALLFYVIQWRGLMSPTAQLQGLHNHFTIIPLALAQAGFCGLFLAPAVIERPLVEYLRDWRVWAGVVIAVILAALPRSGLPTQPSGVLASLAAHTPVLFDRILVLLPPSALGGAAFAVLFIAAAARGRGRAALIILVGFCGWLAAHTTPAYALRQYCDIIMILFIWLAALSLPSNHPRTRFYLCTGVLALIQLAMAVSEIYLPVLGHK